MSKKALITGITGQDGSYLAELLLSKGYEVHGIIRKSSSFNTGRIDHIFNKLDLHYGDVTDSININSLIQDIQPDELYNLAAMSHVQVSFEIPGYTAQTDAIGALNCIESIRKYQPDCRYYFAATSELYGGQDYNRPEKGYNENSPFHPRSPYGVAKLYGYWITRNYREAYDLHASSGILFNHSSSRRGGTFLTRKVTSWCGENHKRLKNNYQFTPLQLGNLYAKRDEGCAIDYVKAMWLMLQQDEPDDYVISTGETYSVKEWVEKCFLWLGHELRWEGKGLDEKGILEDGRVAVEVDERYFRPSEVDFLLGDCSKAKKELQWTPEYDIDNLVDMMMKSDMKH